MDMAHYLIEVSYTPQSWSNQIDHPASAIERITPSLDACGASLVGLYYAFGDVDVVGIIDFPAPEDAAAWSLAIGSSGALKMLRTTPLMSIDQGIDALGRAGNLRKVYSPPITVSLDQPATASR